MKMIAIDFEIHKMIEAERTGFDEPEYVALRRLLGLAKVAPEANAETTDAKSGRPFVSDGVSIPHGSPAQMFYQRGAQHYLGKFLDGALVVGEKRYPSLSAAACDLARTKDGKRTSLDGWLYWEVMLPGDSSWTPMKELREN